MQDDATRLNQLHRRSRKATAAYVRDKFGIPCTEGSLANMASSGIGPTYRLYSSRAYYLDQDVDIWAQARISAPVRKASDARRRDNQRVAP
jgi:hypothetical protein